VGFAEGLFGGFGIVQSQVLGVVEQAMSQLVGAGQPPHRPRTPTPVTRSKPACIGPGRPHDRRGPRPDEDELEQRRALPHPAE